MGNALYGNVTGLYTMQKNGRCMGTDIIYGYPWFGKH